jgi:hypothetical protein
MFTVIHTRMLGIANTPEGWKPIALRTGNILLVRANFLPISGRMSSSSLEQEPTVADMRNVCSRTNRTSHTLIFSTVTGCIRPEKLDRLNPKDSGGQYDSSGGAGGKGNPQGSVCLGYKHYVEVLEPAGPRACIRCCDDPADCPTNKGTHIFNVLTP